MDKKTLNVKIETCISKLLEWLKIMKMKSKHNHTKTYKGLFIDLVVKDKIYTGDYDNVGIYIPNGEYGYSTSVNDTNTKRIIISKYGITPEKIRSIIINEFKLTLVKARIKDIEEDF